MNQQEKHAIIRIIANMESPSVRGIVYTTKGDTLVREEVRSYTETDRLLKSEDFKAGWNECYEQLKEFLTFFVTASPADLRKFAGKPKKGER